MSYLSINGIDITRFIAAGGFGLSENDLDSPKAGRTLDGIMHRGKVTSKNRADVKLIDVNSEVFDPLLTELRKEYVTVETDMFPGQGDLTMEMYNSTRKYNVSVIDSNGVTWYQDASFNIIER